MTVSPLLKSMLEKHLSAKLQSCDLEPDQRKKIEGALIKKQLQEPFLDPGKKTDLTQREEQIEPSYVVSPHGIAEQKKDKTKVSFTLYTDFLVENIQKLEKAGEITPGRFTVVNPTIRHCSFIILHPKAENPCEKSILKIQKKYPITKKRKGKENLKQAFTKLSKEEKEKLIQELCLIIHETGLANMIFENIQLINENQWTLINTFPFGIYEQDSTGDWQINQDTLRHNAAIGLEKLYYSCLFTNDADMAEKIRSFIGEYSLKTENCPVCKQDFISLEDKKDKSTPT